MWRIPSERVPLDLGGPTVEVERIQSWALQYRVLAVIAAFNAASNPTGEYEALSVCWALFEQEAQPTWDIVDHRGAVPATAQGMARLPHLLMLAILEGWAGSYRPTAVEPEPESAADALLPPAVAREVKKRLKAVA